MFRRGPIHTEEETVTPVVPVGRARHVGYMGLALGLALFTTIILYRGMREVAEALAVAGVGVLGVALFHVVPLVLDALGWRRLLQGQEQPGVWTMVRARWIGEAINGLLPVLQIGGNLVKAGLVAQAGVPGARAGASVVVDVTLVVTSQVCFTLLGLAIFAAHVGGAELLPAAATGACLMAAALGGFYAAQRGGAFERLARGVEHMGRGQWASLVSSGTALDRAIADLYANRRTIAAAWTWHLVSWLVGVGEVWLALRYLGHPVHVADAVLLESLGQAVRAAAFAVPGALGIQEGGFLALGTALGIPPNTALALSIVKRVREIVLGLPGLAVWQLGMSPPQERGAVSMMSRGSSLVPLTRVLNRGGRAIERAGIPIVRLDADELVAEACSRARLEDFGDETFREPLRRLVASLDHEAQLNLIGRIAARQDIIRLLANRLRMVRDQKTTPEILARPVVQPIFVTGLPRTGTTLLQGLLAQDPENRAALNWETMSPSPPPERSGRMAERHIAQAERFVRWFHRLNPAIKRMHPVGARLPEECLIITSHSFYSYQFQTMYDVPSYETWLEAQDLRTCYAWHRRVLQQLQWRSPGKWVLKAPAHLFGVEAILATYPDAGIVFTHRDPLPVAASLASLTTALRSTFSDDVDPTVVGPEMTTRWADGLYRALRARDAATASASQFYDVRYGDLLRDPIGTVRTIYSHYGRRLSAAGEQAMRTYLAQNPKDKHGRHEYSLEEFGLDPAREETRYKPYRERFGV